jgi:hypothetical protein
VYEGTNMPDDKNITKQFVTPILKIKVQDIIEIENHSRKIKMLTQQLEEIASDPPKRSAG